MKRIFLIISFLTLFAGSALATTITVSGTTLQNWRFSGSTAKLRIFADTKFVTSTAQIVMPGQVSVGNWYKEVNCTVSGTVLTIPSFTIDSTTDSSVTRASYTFVLFDSKNVRRDTYADSFRIPHTLGATLSWVQLITYNQAQPRPATAGVYNSEEVNTLIADLATLSDVNDAVTAGTATLSSGQTTQVNSIVTTATNTLSSGQATQVNGLITSGVAGKVDTTDTRLERELSKDYSNSFASANSNNPSAKVVLKINTPVTVASSVAVNANICVDFGDDGAVTIAAEQTLTINCLVNPGNRKIFTSTASGARVLFSKAAVPELNLAWWVGNTPGANITDALGEALESANAAAGKIYIPAGQWYSTGAHSISGGVSIRGAGNSNAAVNPNGTTLTLLSSANSYLFKIGEGVISTRISDIILDGTGTTGKTGLLFEGTGGSTSTSQDFFEERVTYQNFDTGLYVHSLGNSWQMAQMLSIQCIFQQNKTANVKFESVNHQWVSIGDFHGVTFDAVAFNVVAAGAVKITGSEFAGALWAKAFTDSDVSAGADTITIANHGFQANDPVYLTTDGVLPTGLSAYMYVLVIDANTVKLSATPGGSPVNITAASGGGAHKLINPTSTVMKISGQHGAITFDSVQDEAFLTFVQNDASDSSSIININNSLIQSKLLLNQSCKVNITQSNILSHEINGPATGAIVSVTDTYIRPISAITGEVVSPPLLRGPNAAAFVTKEELVETGYFRNFMPRQDINCADCTGSPTNPVHGFYYAYDGGPQENKVLIQYGRTNAAFVPEYFYSIYRDKDTGRSVTAGNQTGFIGYDFLAGDLWTDGAVRSKAAALTDGATITATAGAGNTQFVTLGGNRTLAMAIMSSLEADRADGQEICFEIKQDASGSRLLSLNTGSGQFAFGTDITSVTLTTTANKTDFLTVKYSRRINRWLVVRFVKGF